MKFKWIFTPWTDDYDFEKFKSEKINSHAFLSGLSILLFHPVRWMVRILIIIGIAYFVVISGMII